MNAYVVGSRGLRAELADAGIRSVRGPRADAVVVGFDSRVTLGDLERAMNAIVQGAAFIATGADRSYPRRRSVGLGTGAVVAALETATGRQAEVVGKPRAPMFELALAGVAGSAVMVGDNPVSDIGGAHAYGIPGVLVGRHPLPSAEGPVPLTVIPDLRGLFAWPPTARARAG